MTIEEALEQLRLGPGINEDVSEEYDEATDMAIEALEREQETGWWINEKCPRCGCRSMLGLCLEHFCPNCGLKMEFESEVGT